MLADVPQTVSLPVATRTVAAAEWRIARKFDHATSYGIRCKFTDVHGTGAKRRGRITTCSFRSYRHGHQVTHLDIDVTLVHRVADATYEDGSGWATIAVQPGEHVKRSLYLNPGAPA